MSTKTISLDEDAYNRLKNLKEDDESFSDVVKKVTDERSLLELTGILSEEEAEELEKHIQEARKRSREGIEEKVKKLE